MSDESTDQGPSDPFGATRTSRDNSARFENDDLGTAGSMLSMSLATDVAKIWVQEHQKASMLGAFAVGVFVGAMLRD